MPGTANVRRLVVPLLTVTDPTAHWRMVIAAPSIAHCSPDGSPARLCGRHASKGRRNSAILTLGMLERQDFARHTIDALLGNKDF